MAVVGEASVRIVADVSKLSADVEAKLKELEKTAEQVGKNLSDRMAEGFQKQSGTNFIDIGDRDGDLYATAFADKMQANLSSRMPQIGNQIGVALGDGIADGAAGRVNSMGDRIDLTESGRRGGEQYWAGMSSVTPPRAPRIPGGGGGGGGAGRRGDEAGEDFGGGFWDSFDRISKNRRAAPFEGMITNVIQNFIQLSSMAAGMYGLVAAVMSLVNSLGVLAAAAGQAAMGFLAMGNIFAALAQGAIVLKSVFGGVGAAIGALNKAQKAAKKSATDLGDRALAQARARFNLKKAILQQGRAQEDALKKVADAEEKYQDALDNEKTAQENVDEARKNAQERIKDLSLELEDASLNEERAVLNLKKAEKALQRARAGGNTNAIYEADLAYREQELSLRKLRESNQDLREEANKTFAEGVDGNEEVQKAQEGVEKAAEGTADALRALTRAQEDAPLAMEDAALRVREAAEALRKALLPPKGADNALNAVNDAMKELSPAAQKFARYWQGTVQPLLKKIKFAGQEAFFPAFQRGVEALVNSRFPQIIEDMFVNTAGVLGDFSENLLKAFTVPENLTSLENIFSSNTRILETLGRAATSLVKPFLQIGEALAPFAEKMAARWEVAANNFAKFIDTAKRTGDLQRFFENAEARMLSMKEMFKAFGPGLKDTFSAALPAADYLIDAITKMGTEWSGSFDDEKMAKMEETFLKSAENAVKILDAVTDIGGWLFNMGANEGIGKIADAFKSIVPQLEKASDAGFDQIADDIARIIESLGGFAEALSKSQALNVFFGLLSWTLKIVSDSLAALANSKIFGWVIPVMTAILGLVSAISLGIGMFLLFRKSWLGFRSLISTIFPFLGLEASKAQRNVARQTKAMRTAARQQSGQAKIAGAILGRAFGQGVAQGIKEQQTFVQGAASNMANAAYLAVKQAWMIASPSQKMKLLTSTGFLAGIRVALVEGTEQLFVAAQQVGMRITAGLAQGLNGTMVANDLVRELSTGLRLGTEQIIVSARNLGTSAAAGARSAGPNMQIAGQSLGTQLAIGEMKTGDDAAKAGVTLGSISGKAADVAGKATNKIAGTHGGYAYVLGGASTLDDAFKLGVAMGKAMAAGEDVGNTGIATKKNIIESEAEMVKAAPKWYSQWFIWGKGANESMEAGLKGKMAPKRTLRQTLGKVAMGALTVGTTAWMGYDIYNMVKMQKEMEAQMGGLGGGAGGAGGVGGSMAPPEFTFDYDANLDINNAFDQDTINNIVQNNTANYIDPTIEAFARGGMVRGRYKGYDSVPAVLTPGEYVLNRDMVQQVGKNRLDAWRNKQAAPTPIEEGSSSGEINDEDPDFLEAVRRLRFFMNKGLSPGTAAAAAATGPVQAFAQGGTVKGRYTGKDTAVAMVTPGEYVLTRGMVNQIGVSYLESIRKGNTRAKAKTSSFAVGGLDIPTWLSNPGAGWQNDINLNDIPLLSDWIEREIKRILEELKKRAWYDSKYDEELKNALTKAVTDTHVTMDAQKKAIQEALALKRAEASFARYGLPQEQINETIRESVPNMAGNFAYAYSYEKGIFDRDAQGRLLNSVNDNVAVAQEIQNQIKLGADWEAALFAAYNEVVQKRIADEAAAAAAEAAAAAAAAAGAGDLGDTDLGDTDLGGTTQSFQAGSSTEQYNNALKEYRLKGEANAKKYGTPSTVGNWDKNYGPWRYPLMKRNWQGKNYFGHNPAYGVDISGAGIGGATIVAAQQGIIRKNGYIKYKKDGKWRGYGNYLQMQHDDGTHSLYAHMQGQAVHRLGVRIASGTIIGSVGNTGGSTGYHLHYEMTGKPGGTGINATVVNMAARGLPNIANKLNGSPPKPRTASNPPGATNRSTGATVTYSNRPKPKPKRGRPRNGSGPFRWGLARYGLAEGGVVHATPGGIEAIIAEGGRDERVTPLDDQGRSAAEVEMLNMMQSLLGSRSTGKIDVVNHIYPAPGMDERALAELVSREIMFTKRKFT